MEIPGQRWSTRLTRSRSWCWRFRLPRRSSVPLPAALS